MFNICFCSVRWTNKPFRHVTVLNARHPPRHRTEPTYLYCVNLSLIYLSISHSLFPSFSLSLSLSIFLSQSFTHSLFSLTHTLFHTLSNALYIPSFFSHLSLSHSLTLSHTLSLLSLSHIFFSISLSLEIYYY